MDNVRGTLAAGSSSDCRLPRRVQYAGTIRPNSEAGQAIRRVGAGVNVDPVEPEVRCRDRRVSMHDDPPVIPDEVEKSAANAQNIVPGLLLKLDPRTHACVHKQIAVGFAVWCCVRKELAMLGRHKRRERFSNLSLRCRREQIWCQTIGKETRDGAQSLPHLKARLSGEEIQEHLLMVAAKENGVDLTRSGYEPGNSPGGVRAAINIVAKIDLCSAPLARVGPIGVNRAMDRVEQIGSAMDIANGIDRNTFGGRRKFAHLRTGSSNLMHNGATGQIPFVAALYHESPNGESAIAHAAPPFILLNQAALRRGLRMNSAARPMCGYCRDAAQEQAGTPLYRQHGTMRHSQNRKTAPLK